jgi:4a-hydroxytetrahydrobiopterin dehydratase
MSLTDRERDLHVKPLLEKSGWLMVDSRDAIYKEFLFKNFNEVNLFI